MREDVDSAFQAHLRRGEILRDQRRYAEAAGYLQQAIATQPDNPSGYHELAFCYCNWDGHAKQALATIDHAIALAPNEATYFALRAWILGNLDRDREAVQVAEQALALNPYQVLALNAQSRSYCDLHQFREAEACARRALEIDPTNEVAGNLLSIALRQQGRLDESRTVSAALLRHAPDTAMTQSNAGWSALQAGDHLGANRHFLEALRLDPNYESARRGLLHSFNSRVWIYRIYFQFIAWLGRHRKEMRIFFVVIVYVVYRMVISTLRTEFGEQGQYWTVVIITFYFALFGFGRSFANFFLLFDPFARHALTKRDKRMALLVGLGYLVPVGGLLIIRAWLQAAVLIAVQGFFLWGVLQPRLQGAYARRQNEKSATS